MYYPPHPLRLNVGFLIGQPVGYSRDFHFEYEAVRLGDDLFLEEFTGTAHISSTHQGLLVQAEFEARITLQCVRCLEEYAHPLHWALTELYAYKKRSMTESGLLLPESGYLDIEPVAREYAFLEVPIKPLCRPTCKGLCPVCGENLNHVDCGHRRAVDESPFSVLKNLYE